jgi:hypothetical protein
VVTYFFSTLCRYLYHLKKKLRNKARVEASTVNAYLVEEASNCTTYYFEPHVVTRSRSPSRHDDGGDTPNCDTLSRSHLVSGGNLVILHICVTLEHELCVHTCI